MVINRVCAGSIGRTERNRRGTPAKHSSPSRGGADSFGLAWELDIEPAFTPYLFKERSVRGLRKAKRDTGRVREAHFLSIDRGTLGLFAVGNPQPVSG